MRPNPETSVGHGFGRAAGPSGGLGDWASELDRQREPLRRLARALLGDPHAAEDVVQDAFTALVARERAPDGPAAWLRAVVKKLALDRRRREARREHRERSGARPECAGGDALLRDGDALARLELVEALAREVRALDEPYRTAVRLRYFEGLGPREIARELDVPLATVESRLVRALDRLRERLDRQGGRERWLGAALAWVHPRDVPWVWPWPQRWMELALMKTVVKLAGAAVLLALAWWSWRAWSAANGELADAPAAAGAVAADETALVAPRVDAGRAPAAASAPVDGASPPTAADATELAGVVVDPTGAPLADVEVGFVPDGEPDTTAKLVAKSGADGRIAFAEPKLAGRLLALGDAWFTIGSPPIGPTALPCERIVCVAPREPLVGRVVDRTGAPVAGVKVEFGLYRNQLTLPQASYDLLPFVRATVSAPDGTYRIDDAPLFELPGVRATRPGSSLTVYANLAKLRSEGGRIVFDHEGEPALVLRGIVVDERERPIPDAFVQLAPKDPQGPARHALHPSTHSDARGGFEFPLFRAQTGTFVITAGASGRALVRVESRGEPWLAESWPSPLALRLDRPAAKLRGRIVDEHGRALPHATVDLLDGTPRGLARFEDGFLVPLQETTWEALASRRDWTQHIDVDDAGQFEITELSSRTYRLVAFDRDSLHWSVSAPLEAGAQDVELVIDTSARRDLVAGRVVDSSGAPVIGASVVLTAETPWRVDAAGETQYRSSASLPVITGPDGRFEFRDVSPDAQFLEAKPPSTKWLEHHAFLGRFDRADDVELALPRLTFARVELSEGALGPGVSPTDVYAVDAERSMLSTSIAGTSVLIQFDAQRRTAVFPIGDTARALLVRQYGDELLEIPVELELGTINVIRR
ncbi:MAG: sigma-70 family RNA polymerase sigma factor [Planctomycetes bacterium]|nr:sigma-70 family RNA polymerase sigma factor [Planctomycetota bacterium]